MATRTSYIVQGFGTEDDGAYIIFGHLWTKNIVKIGTRRRYRDLLERFLIEYFNMYELPEPEFMHGMNIRYTFEMTDSEYTEILNVIKSTSLLITTTNKIERLM